MKIRQLHHLPVDMHKNVIARIVQAVDQSLEKAELSMGKNQVRVFHTVNLRAQ